MDIKPREFRIQLRENLSQVISGDVAVAVLCVHRNRLSDFYRTRVRSLAMLVSDSLTHSLTDSCLVNLIDVTLACEDANSKLVVVVNIASEVVTVADVDAEDHVGNNLLIWELAFGHKVKLLFRL